MAFGPITSWQIDGETMDSDKLFSWDPKSLQMVAVAMKLKMLAPQKKNYDRPRECIKKQIYHFVDKVHIVKVVVLPVVIHRCESWTIKKTECQRIDAFELEKTLQNPLDSEEIKPVNPKGNQQ